MAVNKKRLLQRAQKLRGWVQFDKKNRLLYEKEVIYEDDFGKLDSEGEGIAFAVRSRILKHWHESLRDLRTAGIKSPFAKTHDSWDQPEDRLGELVGSDFRANEKGIPSLFLRILFDDEKSRDIGLKGDVSIGSPEVWYDGKKRKWEWPLQHVASTNAPVVPDLEPWRKIAASFSKSNTAKGHNMEPDDLIALLGITVEDGAGDDVKWALIKQKLAELTGNKPAKEGEGEEPAVEEVAASHEDDEARRKAAAANASGNGTPVPQAKRVTVAFSHDDPTVELYRDSNVERVNALIENRVVTPAVGKFITTSFCDSKDIAFDLTHKRGGTQFKKVIELVKMIAKDRPLNPSGRSLAGGDESAIELSHNQASDVLTKNAEKRAKAAAR